jgi:hypothetical protein
MHARYDALTVRSISLVVFVVLYVIASFAFSSRLAESLPIGIRDLSTENLLFGPPLLILGILVVEGISTAARRPAFNATSMAVALAILGAELAFVWLVVIPAFANI